MTKIKQIFIRPFQLERLEHTKSCTASSERKVGDEEVFTNIDEVWHKIDDKPMRYAHIVTFGFNMGVYFDTRLTNHIDNWEHFCQQHSVLRWCYIQDIAPI